MISIIIPALEESSVISKNLGMLADILSHDDEVIVVDGGSTDGTAEIVLKHSKAKLIRSAKKGRAVQMNLGALSARNGYLLFLHADTVIDREGVEKLKKECEANTPWGWFLLRLDSKRFIYRILETLARLRTSLANEPLGDHGIFIRKDIFERAGGYPDTDIMEDVEMVKKLKRYSSGKCIDHYILTSVRRFERGGIFRTSVRMVILRILHFLRIPSNKLKNHYKDLR